MHRKFTVVFAASALFAVPAVAQTHSHADVHAHIQAHMQAHGHNAAMHDSLMKLHGHTGHDTTLAAKHHLMLDVIAKELVGTWSGSVAMHNSPGNMQVVIARDSAWRATLSIAGGGQTASAVGRNVKVMGPMVTWTQMLHGTECTASAMLAVQEAHPDGTLNGRISCGRDTLTFSARKEATRH